MDLLFLYLFIALTISFICSILEASLLSITPSFVEIIHSEGKSYAPLIKKYKEHIDQPITAILTLNTFANTLGAAGIGAQAQVIWGNEYLTLVSVALTIIILITGEIIPKTMGATYWKKLAPFTAYSVRILVFLVKPIVLLAPFITKIIKSRQEISNFSRQDFHVFANMGEKSGALDSEETSIIRNLLKFKDILVEDIMTPRPVVIAFDKDTLLKNFYEGEKDRMFSRIPIYKDNIDNIIGFILKEDLLLDLIKGNGDTKLYNYKRDIISIYEDAPLPELYGIFKETKQQIAIVIDDYGGFAGLVTMEDVIETLLGIEITDEFDEDEDMQDLARKNWAERAKKLGIISNIDSANELKKLNKYKKNNEQ